MQYFHFVYNYFHGFIIVFLDVFLHFRISVHWVPALSGLWLVVIVHMGSSEDRAATQGLLQTPNCQLAFSCNSLQKQHRDSWVTLQSTQHTKKTVTLIRPPPPTQYCQGCCCAGCYCRSGLEKGIQLRCSTTAAPCHCNTQTHTIYSIIQ